MCAINAKNETTITLLLKNNADVNATDNQQATCLHLAALKDKNGSIIQLLLRHKPDIERKNDLRLTPLFLAAFSGNGAVTRWLLLSGAESETKEAYRYGALHYACT
jgi:ankyrin repeat protein